MANRLVNETSPYLRQHAHNPVDWYPWRDEAVERAVKEDRPVLLSIGYSACHWCHVMERESFEDPETARMMNEDFISIKVDREERPDLDAVYMEAVQAITGSGGWPLTVFLTPQKKPFFGGTYFPPENRMGVAGFPRVLETVARAYRTRKDEIESAGDEVIAHLKQSAGPRRVLDPLTTGTLSTAYASLESGFDTRNGGFGPAPKFPQPMALEFLLRYHHRTGDKEALRMVELSLERMARGGMYDQIGGGFHRYSVDDRWLVPHFEKMLYDNALLARLYLHAYQATGKPLYRQVVEQTLDYVLREMTGDEGGFYSSQDADSEGVEGKYYTWTLAEIVDALGEDDAGPAARYFGATEGGNFEGVNILTRAAGAEELEAGIAHVKARLLERRAGRVAPHRDEKVLADWNGLMLAALAEAASVLDREDYLQAAVANGTFLLRTLLNGGGLKHSYKDGDARISGYLLDYAAVIDGLLALYQATLDDSWLNAAKGLADSMIEQFWDASHGQFYDTGDRNEGLPVRPRNIYDNALPSGASAASSALLQLARITGNGEYERIAASGIRSVQDYMARYPTGFGHWLCALESYLSRPTEIAVIGDPGDPATKSLLGVVNARYLPGKVLAGGRPNGTAPSVDVPLLKDRNMVEDRPTAYVCEDHTCKTPVTDPEALAALLDQR
jgi:uncharacterized protein YyaL (SSP411 family)